ncbi:MAG: 50S ribosomal protein L11 methyltransferase [Pyrinomonadaceae bacterium]
MTNPDKQKWFAIAVTVEAEAAEAVEFAFNEIDALGTEINHLRKTAAETVVVNGFFYELPADAAFKVQLEEALRIYGLTPTALLKIEKSEIEQTDWLAEWKKHWKPTEIGGFVIAPPWEEFDDSGKIVIRIEPNMAFGTGTHETTQLCVKAIEDNYKAGQTFLDVGTGTGILAIAAAKYQTGCRILACDTDVDSVAIAKENAELNGVGGKIEFYIGSIDEKAPRFDFVCANLTIDVILPILPQLLDKSVQTLVLSGILQDQQKMIVSALHAKNIQDFNIEEKGEWISIIVRPVSV